MLATLYIHVRICSCTRSALIDVLSTVQYRRIASVSVSADTEYVVSAAVSVTGKSGEEALLAPQRGRTTFVANIQVPRIQVHQNVFESELRPQN